MTNLLPPCTMLVRDLFGGVRTLFGVDGSVHVNGATLVGLGEVPIGVPEVRDRRWRYSILLCSGAWSSCWSGGRWPDLLATSRHSPDLVVGGLPSGCCPPGRWFAPSLPWCQLARRIWRLRGGGAFPVAMLGDDL